jgi:rhodanese-related sulfurtransferase
MVATISPQDLAECIERGEVREIIDVRTPAEFREVHAPAARNVPLDELTPEKVVGTPADRPIYFVCQGGGRSAKACQKLIGGGITNVVSVEGGTHAWQAAGLPVVRGKKAISLERQVRIAAGSLVLLGILLAYVVHPYLIGLSAFVGAGLVFAGVTDTCGMAMLLARMPWNKV